ncbi:hypothetical protein VNO78_05076 [Psophocarpus tetragonolobus]|uniref:Uncharacterized protein n=1 Tax=Psophocarpus tetragonolobus TaxID=3891 RepID=A0AAN9SSH7_PSOTE
MEHTDPGTKTDWGQRVGWIYESVTEDVVTGYRMHNRGWKSVYCAIKRDAFRGTAPIKMIGCIRGVGHKSFPSLIKDLRGLYKPSILIVIEPRISGSAAAKVRRNLGLPLRLWVSLVAFGCSRILIILISKLRCQVIRNILWHKLMGLSNSISGSWLLIGDFNAHLHPSDKIGRTPPNARTMDDFQQCIDACNLLDLGFKRPKFTWEARDPLTLQQAMVEFFRGLFSTDNDLQPWLISGKSEILAHHSLEFFLHVEESRGVGIKKMEVLNRGIIMKLALGILTNPDALWVRVLKAKYNVPNKPFPTVKHQNNESHVWKAIASIWDEFLQGVCWIVGDGLFANFWKDTWLLSGKIILYYAELDISDNMLQVKVADMCFPKGTWGLDKPTWALSTSVQFSVGGIHTWLFSNLKLHARHYDHIKFGIALRVIWTYRNKFVFSGKIWQATGITDHIFRVATEVNEVSILSCHPEPTYKVQNLYWIPLAPNDEWVKVNGNASLCHHLKIAGREGVLV